MFFGNTDINIILPEHFSSVCRQSESSGRSGRQNDNIFVFLHFAVQEIKGDVIVVFGISQIKRDFAGLNVKR